jgi:hypothetical protein
MFLDFRAMKLGHADPRVIHTSHTVGDFELRRVGVLVRQHSGKRSKTHKTTTEDNGESMGWLIAGVIFTFLTAIGGYFLTR